MRLSLLLALFVGLMVLQTVVLTEAFGQPGTQIQMNASKPLYFVAAVPNYS